MALADDARNASANKFQRFDPDRLAKVMTDMVAELSGPDAEQRRAAARMSGFQRSARARQRAAYNYRVADERLAIAVFERRA